MNRWRRAILGAVCAGAAFGAARTADAIPAFARKYQTACGTCHAGAYPELNAWGRRFKEGGFQYPAGGEAAYRESSSTEPGAGEKLVVLDDVPLALRTGGTVVVPTDPEATGANRVDFRVLENLFVLAGGSVAPDVSVFAAATVAPAGLHHAEIGFHDLGAALWGDGSVNLRVGRFLLWDFLRPEHRTVTHLGNPGAVLKVGWNPTTLDTIHHGFDGYGRLFARRLFWEVALTQGAQGADGVRDLDSWKDLFGQVQVTLGERQTLGALGYLGRTQITDDTAGVKVRFTDSMRVAGLSADLGRGPVGLFGWVLWRNHTNPMGDGDDVTVYSARAEVNAWIAPRWLFVVRWDQVISGDDHDLEQNVATVHASFLPMPNLKLSAESNADLGHLSRSLLTFKVDLAL